MSSACSAPLGFINSKVSTAIYQEILKHLMLYFLSEKLYGEADFIVQQDLVPTYPAKGTNTCVNEHGITRLDVVTRAKLALNKCCV